MKSGDTQPVTQSLARCRGSDRNVQKMLDVNTLYAVSMRLLEQKWLKKRMDTAYFGFDPRVGRTPQLVLHPLCRAGVQ
jgi:hypothetical protein